MAPSESSKKLLLFLHFHVVLVSIVLPRSVSILRTRDHPWSLLPAQRFLFLPSTTYMDLHGTASGFHFAGLKVRKHEVSIGPDPVTNKWSL